MALKSPKMPVPLVTYSFHLVQVFHHCLSMNILNVLQSLLKLPLFIVKNGFALFNDIIPILQKGKYCLREKKSFSMCDLVITFLFIVCDT